MEKIVTNYEYSPACYKYGGHPGPNATKYYYTEYVEYAKDGRPYFIVRWHGSREDFDSEPYSYEGKKLFPNLTQKCPHCGSRLNLTRDTCENCHKFIDNPIRIGTEPDSDPAERILELLFKYCLALKLNPSWEGSIKEEVHHRQMAIIDLCEVLQVIRIDQEIKKVWADKVKQLAEDVKNYGSYTGNAAHALEELFYKRFKFLD